VTFAVGDLTVGSGRCLIIGEVAQAHDGSLGMAHAFIDAIAEAGADAVKFQTHIAEAESTLDEAFRVPLTRQDPTRYAYWQRTAFRDDEWRDLATHASRRGLAFLSSPFSIAAVDLLERIGMPAWKIGSGELTNVRLLERIARTRAPVLLSTGLSAQSEIDEAVRLCRRLEAPFAVVQATSLYPCPPEKIGLNLLREFRDRYECPVGLSDHSGTIFPALGAATLGADLVEVHVTFHRAMFGPDVTSSVTVEELGELVRGVRFLEAARQHAVAKDDVLEELAGMRSTFRRSLCARVDLDAGTILRPDHVDLKKPGTGLSAAEIGSVVGRRLRRSIRRDHLLQWDDLEPDDATSVEPVG